MTDREWDRLVAKARRKLAEFDTVDGGEPAAETPGTAAFAIKAGLSGAKPVHGGYWLSHEMADCIAEAFAMLDALPRVPAARPAKVGDVAKLLDTHDRLNREQGDIQ